MLLKLVIFSAALCLPTMAQSTMNAPTKSLSQNSTSSSAPKPMLIEEHDQSQSSDSSVSRTKRQIFSLGSPFGLSEYDDCYYYPEYCRGGGRQTFRGRPVGGRGRGGGIWIGGRPGFRRGGGGARGRFGSRSRGGGHSGHGHGGRGGRGGRGGHGGHGHGHGHGGHGHGGHGHGGHGGHGGGHGGGAHG